MTQKKVLDVQLYRKSSPNAAFEQELESLGFVREFHGLGSERTLPVLLKSVFIPRFLSQYDVIVTSEYFSSFGISLRLLLTLSRTKHVTVGLNQSKRLLKTGIGWIDALVNRVFRRTDLIVVHSRREAELFVEAHAIPKNKFHFSLWGFDLPQIAASRFSQWPKPFVCQVGRNNRDASTFIAALRGLDVDGIIITSAHGAPAEPLPPNIHLFVDLPMDETLDCMRQALASLILLKDGERGAGHITAVAAMLLGTPQIVSDSEVITDYVVDGVSALTVKLGDAPAVQAAIERLRKDRAYAEWISANAKEYAEQWLTNTPAARRVARALSRAARGEPSEFADGAWLETFENFRRRTWTGVPQPPLREPERL